MADAHPNSDGPSVDQPGMAKKKKAKAPRKSWAECTPEEIANLDEESAKRRNRRAAVKDNAAAHKFAAERDAMEAARRKIEVEEKEAIVNKAHALLMLGICRPAVHGGRDLQRWACPCLRSRETQSQDGRAQFVADEEADDRADYDHGDSWHGDDDIYCEAHPKREAQKKKKKSIHTGSYTQDEDKLICNSWMEISQDPRTGAQQKGLVFWTRVHKTFHERKMFEPYQITSDRGITSIQKRWLFIQQECNKYCAALEIIEARPVSGLGIGEMAFQSLEAFKARHNNKPFTLTHCWTIINDCPKFKDQYRELQRKRGKKTAKFAGGGDGEALKRPRGKTNSKVDDIRDAASMALHETLHGMMSQKDMRDEKKRKKLEMEEAPKKRKIDLEEVARQRQLDIEAANVEARKRQLDIEATNAATKAKEVALVIMSVDLTKMSEKTRSWFEDKQKERLDADDLN
uniref:Putative DBINO protein n=1 Tax=Hordeum vulgare subsp. vulgare TaxID=112509 RepID=A0A023INK3_HORVV|nr:putative DBINO protein [Hordeum vulgare subsp. vulgare]